MIKIPLDQIISKIKDGAKISEEEINKKIDEKMEQLSGLVSREGAAHIVANELGVKVFEGFSGRLQIKNIMTGMRDVEVVGKVQEIFGVREFKTEKAEGKVASFILGDETGTIRVVLWGNKTDNIEKMKGDMIIKLVSGYVRENNAVKELHLGDRGNLLLEPEGETVGDVKHTLAVRKNISQLTEKDSDVELLGTIVQVSDPRFFEICPECNKRARQHEDSFVCGQHGKIDPAYSYVLNAVLDDGHETIRTVFFRNQADRLLNMSHEDVLKYKTEPERFDDIKNKLLGEQIKVTGRVNKNEMFDRLEFITRLVFTNPDPQEEIKRLEQEAKVK